MWWLLMVVLAADSGPPQFLYVSRDFLKPGVDDEYRRIADDGARICAEMTCPNPYIGIESLTRPKEAWWFNGFPSEEAMKQVGEKYAQNKPLSEALNRITQRKAGLIRDHYEAASKYREDLSHGPAWQVGRGRFVVITVTKGKPEIDGTVFEAPDGIRFIISAAQTRAEADKVAGAEARVFAVRPNWSMPAKDWVASDPDFWKTAPAPKVK